MEDFSFFVPRSSFMRRVHLLNWEVLKLIFVFVIPASVRLWIRVFAGMTESPFHLKSLRCYAFAIQILIIPSNYYRQFAH